MEISSCYSFVKNKNTGEQSSQINLLIKDL